MIRICNQCAFSPGQLSHITIDLLLRHWSFSGFNVRSISDFTSDRYHHSVLMQAVPVPGFLALQNLLSFHASSQPVLKLLLQFFIGQYDTLPRLNEVSLFFVSMVTIVFENKVPSAVFARRNSSLLESGQPTQAGREPKDNQS